MNRIFKWALWAIAGLLLAAAAVIGFIVATFDPNAYKPQLVQLVKQQKHRDLKLGDIKLSFFPSLGAQVSQLALSERDSTREFAAADQARVSLKLLPLLSKKAVVDAVELHGLRINLLRHQDGSTNIDDLLGQGESRAGAGKVEFDIGHVAISDFAFAYRDQQSGAKYELAHASLKTGRIANRVPSELELNFAVQGTQPKLDLHAQLTSRFTFDLDGQRYALHGLQLAVKGAAAGVTDLVLNAAGDFDLNLPGQEFSASRLDVVLTGKRGGDNIELKLTAPSVALVREQFGGDKATLNFKLDGGGKSVAASVVLSEPVGSMQSLKAALALNLAATLPGAPALAGDLRGNFALDQSKQNVQVNLAGKLLSSQIKAKLGMLGYTHPAYHFDLELDQLDMDRLLPPKKPSAQAAKTDAAEQALDFSALQGINASGSIRIGSLKSSKFKASQIRLDLKAANGMLAVNPISAVLYQGTLNGSATLHAAGPRIALKQNLAGVSIAPLLQDIAGKDLLEGKGRIVLDVATQGATLSQMKKGLNGNLALNLSDGAVKGINLGAALRSAQAKLGAMGGKGEQTQAANAAEKTDFSEMKASFDIKNGVAHNQDLLLKSPLLRVTGAGDINLGADSLDYLAKATLVATAEGQGGKELAALKGVTVPVRVVGTYAALQYKIDVGAMVGETAKQKLEEKKQEIKSKLQDELQQGLKGLFR